MNDPFDAFTSPVDDGTAALLGMIDDFYANDPPPMPKTAQEFRDRLAANSIVSTDPLPEGETRTIKGPNGDIDLRIFAPDDVKGIYLHIHGGGWISGSASMFDRHNKARAEAASMVALSVDYRIAPEFPYPAPADDCEAAVLWVVQRCVEEFGTDVIVIGGESAGSNLGAVVLQRMRDKHGFTGFRAAEFRYGMFDLRLTPSVRLRERGMLNRESVAWMLDHYVPNELRHDPDVSPLLGRLHDMPPALFTVGTEDSLLDDTLFMYCRWRAAGNDAELKIYPGAIHGMDLFPMPAADRWIADVDDFLKRARSTEKFEAAR